MFHRYIMWYMYMYNVRVDSVVKRNKHRSIVAAVFALLVLSPARYDGIKRF